MGNCVAVAKLKLFHPFLLIVYIIIKYYCYLPYRFLVIYSYLAVFLFIYFSHSYDMTLIVQIFLIHFDTNIIHSIFD